MRIAQVAPLFESVPPKLYGGTERVVSYLSEELVRLGHDVTLFASGDSITSAHLVSGCCEALRLSQPGGDPLALHFAMMAKVLDRAKDFDLIHFHTDYLHFPFFRKSNVFQLTTLHGRLDIPDLVPVFEQFREMPVVSISNAQRKPLSWLNWRGTVYHGLPVDSLEFLPSPGEYLAFLGRVSPEKGVDRAIKISAAFGMPLKIAAKIDKADEGYFQEVIRPLLECRHVEFVGEIGECDKAAFLGSAYALLFPIDWPEPFGLVMIEAMACGTPVIAYSHGSVPELIEDGLTGFWIRSLEEGVRALKQVPLLSRRRIRDRFVERFSAIRMATDYLRLYDQLELEETAA
jgi:glycosyltransferase involved in cell wall biosynthesis